MARIRSIHPSLTTDENFMSMSIACKAFWPLLWTECDDKGIFEWKPIVLKARLFPADQIDIAELLRELVELGCVIRFDDGGKFYGAVRNFCKYQRPKKPNSVHPISVEAMSFVAFKGFQSETGSEPVENQSETDTEEAAQMEDEGGNKEEEGKSVSRARSAIRYSAEFENFWKAYPTDPGMSKKTAWAEWEKLDEPSRALAISAISGFKAWVAKQGKDYRTVHACRYLSQRRFDGFAPVAASHPSQYFVIEKSQAWDAWVKANGKAPPVSERRTDRGIERGWYFPTEYPPHSEAA